MKILFITPRFPYPPIKGDQALPYYRLRALGARHEITLLTFYEKASDLSGLKELKPFCREIHAVKLPRWLSLANMLFLGAFSSLPFQVLYFRSPAFSKKLDQVLAAGKYDLVHAFMLRLGPYLERITLPKVLELIDSMKLNMERRVGTEGILTRWLFLQELRRVTAYEGGIGRFADRLIVVSNKDKESIPDQKVLVIPLGVDLDLFKPAVKNEVRPVIAFTGNMGYAPNVNAARWFADNCFEQIKQQVPAAEFVIAGVRPAASIRALAARPGITVTGPVSSMSDLLAGAAVSVAPMQAGSGMQFKILEAMACGLPVVTTTLGLGDIRAVPGEHLLEADSAADFTEAVVSLLRSPETRERLGQKARKFIVEGHSWQSAAAEVEKIYGQNVKLNSRIFP